MFPGDMLYIPDGWWHSTISCSESVAVAIQFHEQEPLWKPFDIAFASKRSCTSGKPSPPEKEEKIGAR